MAPRQPRSRIYEAIQNKRAPEVDQFITGRDSSVSQDDIYRAVLPGRTEAPQTYSSMLNNAIVDLEQQGLLTPRPVGPRIAQPEYGYMPYEVEKKKFDGIDQSDEGPLFDLILKPLQYGLSIPASTGMEIADLVTGEGVSAKDWWHQSFTEPISWRNVREKHPDIYKWMLISPVAPFAAIPATLDVLGWESAADLSADFIFDLWNVTGGLNKFVGVGKGASRVAMDLTEATMGAAPALTGAVADAARQAAVAINQGGSLSAGIRVLRQTSEGREVMRLFGLTPGLRVRVPGTGPGTRWLGLDKLPGVNRVIARRRAQQVPQAYKDDVARTTGRKVTDEELAEEILRQRKATPIGGKAGNVPGRGVDDLVYDPEDPFQALAELARRMPVEVRMKGNPLLEAPVVHTMDAPIRAGRRVKNMIGDEVWETYIKKWGLTALAAPYKFLDNMIKSDDARVAWVGQKIKSMGRQADWKSRDFNEEMKIRIQQAVDRAALNGVDDRDLWILANMDDVFDIADGVRVRRMGLPDSVADLSDDELQEIFDLARKVDSWAAEQQIAARGKPFEDTVNEVIDEDGAYVHRMPTPEGRELITDATDLPPGTKLPEGRYDAAAMKERKVRVGRNVEVVVKDKTWQPPEGFDPNRIRTLDNGDRVVRLIDEVASPREVGMSVPLQVNEAAVAAGLPRIYEESFAKVWGRYADVVGDDYRMRLIENGLTDLGLMVEEMGDLNVLNKIRAQVVDAERRLRNVKANEAKSREGIRDAYRKRTKWWKEEVRPKFPNDQKGLELAIKWEQVTDDASRTLAEYEIIELEFQKVAQLLKETPKSKGAKSLRDANYTRAIEKATYLVARVRQLRDLTAARDEVVNILGRMRSLEGQGLPSEQAYEARALARSRRGVTANDEALALDAYEELSELLADQLAFIENELIPSIYAMAERYGLETVEADQLAALVLASKGKLDKSARLKKTASKRIEEFDRLIDEFSELDMGLGFESQLATANGMPIEVQAAKAVTDLQRQTGWLEQQFASLGAADEVARQTPGGMDLPTGRFDEPEILMTRREQLQLEGQALAERKAEILNEMSALIKERESLFAAMQDRFRIRDQALANGDKQNAAGQENLAKVILYEAEAGSINFDEIMPLYDDFQRTLTELGIRAEEGVEALADIDMQVSQAYQDLLDGLEALGAVPVRESKETLDLLQNVLRQDNKRWGLHHVITGSDTIPTEDVLEVLEAFKTINHRAAAKEAIQGWNTFQRFLKSQQLATPGFVLRNIQGAFWNAWQAGVEPTMLIRSYRMLRQARKVGQGDYEAGVRILADQGRRDYKLMLEVMDMGVMRSGQGATSVTASLRFDERVSEIISKRKRGARKGQARRLDVNPLRPEFFINQGIRQANNMAEDAIRLGTGMHVIGGGGGGDDAMALIARTQFDYNELSAFERDLKRWVFPFWTWTRKNIPLQLSMMWRHPGKLNRLMTIKRNIEAMSEEEGNVPAFYMQPFGIRLPFAPGGSTAYFVPDLPFRDLFRADPTGEDFFFKEVLSDVTPAVKAPIEVVMQKQFFKGIPISNRYQKVPLRWAEIPGLKQALELMPGGVFRNGKMRTHHIYAIEQMLPIYGRLRRIIPTEDRLQGYRHMQSFLSMGLGLPVRFNTPEMQRMARRTEKMKRNARRQDRRDINDDDR